MYIGLEGLFHGYPFTNPQCRLVIVLDNSNNYNIRDATHVTLKEHQANKICSWVRSNLIPI